MPMEPRPDQQERPVGRMDPSESVTLFAIMFGVIGALVGLVAGMAFPSNSQAGVAILNCLIAMLAGGSAGIVAGGTVGATVAVFRGVRVPKERRQEGRSG
ncbi:hypothetical protein [Sinorhizobium terangae]|uniref:hypothetical protein n=1 Tax=Sinorhizobium terangae TaxID=110322 RepID=UPI003D1602E7